MLTGPCIAYITSVNATSDCIGPVLDEVVQVVAELISALQALTLSDCACTANDIIELLASTLKVFMISPFANLSLTLISLYDRSSSNPFKLCPVHILDSGPC